MHPVLDVRLVNLTPHPINFFASDGCELTFQPSGIVAHVEQKRELVLDLITRDGHNVTVTQSSFGEVTGVPEPRPNIYYVVSLITAQALKALGRTEDILIVDAAVRGEENRIIGCRGFARV